MTSDGKITKHVDKTTIPNGLVWSADNKTFFHIDTPIPMIAAYDFDAKTGTISNKRKCIDTVNWPDGCCIDSEDKIWAAHFA